MTSNTAVCRGGDLHRGQRKIIESVIKHNKKFSIINASRQSGKTYLLKQLVLYFSINNPNTSTLIVSPYVSQNLRIFDDISSAIKDSKIIRKENRSEKIIELINGSKLVFRSAENYDAIRGGSYDYVFCDEFAYFKKDAWTLAIRPTMAAKKDSRAFIFSTPRGKNEFYDMSMRGQSEDKNNSNYTYFYMSYTDNPLYDVDFVKDCKAHYPKGKFDQEFMGVFTDSASVFDYQHCAVLDSYMEPGKGIKYFAGLDLANKVDKTVLTIMDEDGNVVKIYSINGVKWNQIVDEVVSILKEYNAHCIIEVNSIGDVVYEMIEAKYHNISPIFTANSNKQEYIEDLVYAFNNVDITIPTKELCEDLHLELDVFEMTFSPKTRKVVYAARPGWHDDHIISLALANKSREDNNTVGEYMVNVGGEWI